MKKVGKATKQPVRSAGSPIGMGTHKATGGADINSIPQPREFPGMALPAGAFDASNPHKGGTSTNKNEKLLSEELYKPAHQIAFEKSLKK